MLLLLSLFACKDRGADTATPLDSGPLIAWQAGANIGPIDAIGSDGARTVVSRGEALLQLPDTPLSREGLPDGPTPFLAVLGEETLAFVHGEGLYSSTGGAWTYAGDGLDNALLGFLNPDALPVPIAITESEGATWMAAAGGVFQRDGAGWRLAPTATSGATNLVFTDVDAEGERVVASAVLPESIIPSDFSGLLSGTVFLSEDGGASWEEISEGLPSLYASAVALDGERLWVGTLDQGVWSWDGDDWEALEGGPSDVVRLSVGAGGLLVGSASRGLWQRTHGAWYAAGQGAVRGGGPGLVALVDGTLIEPQDGAAPEAAPESAGGQVHIALSFHGNYYHSYRGDSPTDDGFGLDIDVIRNTLGWLDAHPEVHADWDFDNAFTTDDWMPEHSPDILEAIAARVAAGQDDVRLMAWNNGAVASMTQAEFTMAIERAKASNAAAFGEWVPGVQPQENMFTPTHLAWYSDLGVDWITLFYAANSFTGPRLDAQLEGAALYNPVTLRAPEGDASMTWVPVYHHADMLEHGGLAGWAQQIHDSVPGDTLLVIHFDADGESWENFDAELDAASALGFVSWSTIQDYLDGHDPVAEVVLDGDQADGTGDGFQSWAEKDWNHRLWTEVMAARRAHTLAAFLGVDESHPGWEDALAWRLLAMSTTNYGLAMPTLHPDRVASGALQAAEARAAADALLADALGEPLPAGKLRLINPRAASGPALLRATLPVSDYQRGQGRVRIYEPSGAAHEAEILSADTSGTPSLVEVAFVAEVAAESDVIWGWRYDPDDTANAEAPDAPELAALEPPFLEQDGQRFVFEAAGEVERRSTLSTTQLRTWDVELDGLSGQVVRHIQAWSGLPGVVVEIEAQLPALDLEDGLESVALTPLRCEALADEISWLTHAGEARTRAARAPVASWNGQTADGWAEVRCGGQTLSVAHDTTLRSSMAFLPLTNQGEQALLLPLGTLWAPSPWHDGRVSGGHGLGEIVVPVVGSQFAPAAPDWGGQAVRYRLLIGEGLDPEVMELFAHPPYALAY